MKLFTLFKSVSCLSRKVIKYVSIASFPIFSPCAYAQYNGSVNPLSQSWSMPTENTLNFSSTAPNQSYSCSYGGGTRSMLYAGLFSGVDQTYVQNDVTTLSGESYSAYPVTHPYSHGAGAGIVIPLKSPAERQMARSCIRIMTLVESEEVMKLLNKFKKEGLITSEEYEARMASLKDKILEITASK